MKTGENTETAEGIVDGESGDPGLVHEESAGVIRQPAFDIHHFFGNGFLEKVFANALSAVPRLLF